MDPPEEIFFLRSPNLLTAAEPAQVVWQQYPTGDHGVQPPGPKPLATIGEEPHIVPLITRAGYYVVFRTSLGYLGCTYSAGPNLTAWQPSAYAQFWPRHALAGPAPMKNPRGPISPKRQPNSTAVLMTFYFNGGFAAFAHAAPLSDRNLMWLAVGLEMTANGTFGMYWSQPELILYDPVRPNGHGYPGPSTRKK